MSVAASNVTASASARPLPTGSPLPIPSALSFSCSSETAGPWEARRSVGWVATPGRGCGVGSPGRSPGTGVTEPSGCRSPPGARASSCAHVAVSRTADDGRPLVVWNLRTAACVREPNSASILSSGVAPSTFSFCWATPTCWSMTPSRRVGRTARVAGPPPGAGAVATWRAATIPATAAFPAACCSRSSPAGDEGVRRCTSRAVRPVDRSASGDARWTPIGSLRPTPIASSWLRVGAIARIRALSGNS